MTKKQEFLKEAYIHKEYLYHFAKKLTKDEDQAKDLLQEVWIKAYKKWGSYEKATNCRAWLAQILRNCFINSFRKDRPISFTDYYATFNIATDHNKTNHLYSAIEDQRIPIPDEVLSSKKMVDSILMVIDKLPDPFKMTATLNFIDGKTGPEIVQILGIPLGTVKSRLSRSRKMIANNLNGLPRWKDYDKR